MPPGEPWHHGGPSRAVLSLPSCLCLSRLSTPRISGLGPSVEDQGEMKVFAKCQLQQGVMFGPFLGEICKGQMPSNLKYAWAVSRPYQQTVCRMLKYIQMFSHLDRMFCCVLDSRWCCFYFCGCFGWEQIELDEVRGFRRLGKFWFENSSCTGKGDSVCVRSTLQVRDVYEQRGRTQPGRVPVLSSYLLPGLPAHLRGLRTQSLDWEGLRLPFGSGFKWVHWYHSY